MKENNQILNQNTKCHESLDVRSVQAFQRKRKRNCFEGYATLRKRIAKWPCTIPSENPVLRNIHKITEIHAVSYRSK